MRTHLFESPLRQRGALEVLDGADLARHLDSVIALDGRERLRRQLTDHLLVLPQVDLRPCSAEETR